MSSPEEFNIKFRYQDINYKISLIKGQKSDKSVQINGMTYAVLGKKEKIETAIKILNSVSLDSILSAEDLEGRLSHIKNEGEWMVKDNTVLPDRQKSVALAIFNYPKKNYTNLLEFINDVPGHPEHLTELFSEYINGGNFELFLGLFKHLSQEHLQVVDEGEDLHVMPVITFTDKPVKITDSFVQELQNFMRDTKFSGVVALSDGTSVHTLSSDHLSSLDDPFAIHSVGKMFTGTLVLSLVDAGILSEDVLKKPMELDADVIEVLPPAVRDQLSKTTLHEVMVHKGRFGNYLQKYQDAIKKALSENSNIPQINSPKDLLAYADEELVEGESYSNLGILLVGLSIEHLYNQQTKEKLSFDEILSRFVLKPAGVKMFVDKMPEGARYNKEDSMAQYLVGGPAGGHWSKVGDLLRFGDWLGKMTQKPNFMRLLDTYGKEFYKDRDIFHKGSIESASAHLSHRIDNHLTVAVMSDMTGLGKASMLARTIHEHLLGN